jgi:hypothetical protein
VWLSIEWLIGVLTRFRHSFSVELAEFVGTDGESCGEDDWQLGSDDSDMSPPPLVTPIDFPLLT